MYEVFVVQVGFNISPKFIIQMVKKKILNLLKKKNSTFYYIMLKMMSKYKCNQSR